MGFQGLGLVLESGDLRGDLQGNPCRLWGLVLRLPGFLSGVYKDQGLYRLLGLRASSRVPPHGP